VKVVVFPFFGSWWHWWLTVVHGWCRCLMVEAGGGGM